MLTLQWLAISQIQKAKGIFNNYLHSRQVSQEEAIKFCDEFKLQYIETSAKHGTNVKMIFEMITNSMYENQTYPSNKDRTIVLDPNSKQESLKKSVGCCKKG